jgi:16S rRNA (cytidine1402-2'-O)-methyltransferase
MSASLYMVATPIGNLEDASPRVRRILSQVSVIACEDTRATGLLLRLLELPKPRLISCHAANERQRCQTILEILKNGEDVAYVCEAGTPGISDPGNLLVSSVREEDIAVVPVTGPSAMTAVLSVCGFKLSEGFRFVGFWPRKQGQARRLLEEPGSPVLVAYESPYRIRKTMTAIAEWHPELGVCLARELSKLHEQVIHGTAASVATSTAWKEKGEFAFVLAGL